MMKVVMRIVHYGMVMKFGTLMKYIYGDESDDKDISLARDDVEPNFSTDDDDVDSDDEEEDEFSDRESSIDPLDKDLDDVDMETTQSEVDVFETPLSYRQDRRAKQAIRAAEGKPRRGPTRGLKSRCWREKNPGEKSYAKISDSMRRVVGDKAAQFISECSLWVKEYCPVNSRNWINMDKRAKERLFDKIQVIAVVAGEWNLPRIVGGVNVKRALNAQCAALYRGWRYRLKEENFVGYSKEQARARRPPGIEQAKWNWLVDDFWSDPKQKVTIYANGEDNANANVDGDTHVQHDEDPIYVKLYEKTHRHKDGTMDAEAEVNLNQLRELHAKEIEEHGVDTLTPFEAFPKVLNECSGYIRGLGYGPKPPKRQRIGADSNEVRDEIQQLQQAVTQRETEISNLKSQNNMLKEQLEEVKIEILQREKKMKEESVEREKQLRQELMAEFMVMMKSSKDVV
ncbi:E3 ubiquitin-protein ligase CHFR [Bienertia sinuspersici]